MATLKFAIKMLLREYKKSLFYIITMMFASCMCFIFFSIINDGTLSLVHYQIQGGGTWAQMDIPFSTMLSFLIIIFCCIMMFYTNNFFVSRKTKEIAIFSISGVGPFTSTMYVFVQTLILVLIASPLGIGAGLLIMPIINNFMYGQMALSGTTYAVSIEAIWQTVVIVVVVIVMLCVFASGFVYRTDIQVLLQEDKQMDIKDTRSLKIPPELYVLLYGIGLYYIFIQDFDPATLVGPVVFCIIGSIGILKQFIPKYVKILKNKVLLTKRYAMIYMSNLVYTLGNSTVLFGAVIGCVSAMISVIGLQINNPREYATSIIGYLVILALLITSIVYKYVMEFQSRKKLYNNMWKIGYTIKELKRIIYCEVTLYYLGLIVIPAPVVLSMCYLFLKHQLMELSFILLLISMYVVPIVLSALITIMVYKSTVISPIKEGK